MLQRAASNAYSWWWASHIRTTQSKWLDTTIHEMEDRVTAMLKLIGADGDSFGKKAELYFKSRPELINHVEEMFRSYQALADRYDRISSELHKANHTIATAFPDQIQFSMQDGDGEGFQKAISGIDLSNFKFPALEGLPMGSRGASRGTSPVPKRTQMHRRITSHMNKENAQEEIDKLQKQILVLQTEKEFLKTSYDSALGRYLDIDRQVVELQDEVCSLQDAFSTGTAIEDNEARALMAARAIMSCEDTLVNLQDQQNRSSEEAKTEFKRFVEAKKKLDTFKAECGQPHTQIDEPYNSGTELIHAIPTGDGDDSIQNEIRFDLQEVCQKVKELIELHPEVSVADLADKVDRLVEKVIDLELATTSQNAQINRMRTEIDDLHKRLQALEEDKSALVADSSKLVDRLKQIEVVLQAVQQIGKSITNGTENIHKEMNEACSELAEFVEKLHESEPQNSDFMNPFLESKCQEEDSKVTSQYAKKQTSDSLDGSKNEVEKHDKGSKGPLVQEHPDTNGSDGEEKILFEEYVSVLQTYKGTDQKLSEIEKKNQEYHTKSMSELKDLKSANAMKDEEIHSLRRMLSSLQRKMNASVPENVEKSEETSKISTTPTTEDKEISDIEEYIKQCQVEEHLASSIGEEKFRAEIDRVLEDNLDFWLRFSTSYHQIRNFQTSFDKLKNDMDKLIEAQAQSGADGVPISYQVAKLESAVLEKKFRDLNTDLQVWMEKNVLLKGELENRFSSLCSIQEEISKITILDKGDEVHFTPFQAAKFQGEVLNMKQENNKVAKELEAGLDHVRSLQVEVGRVLLKLRENLELSIARSNRAQQNFRKLSTKAGVPLRTFLFGTKPKKPSLFSCMGPGVHKHHGGSRAGRR
ncbi:protein NETWORKED 2A-like [Oryza brachyantha]|uniref:NAB domain-containing protein n=1 Tax=Oryza brachyantha TaxID=4533 RepID=J3M7Z5_ORYBR|nr:protein NETWORKED 2A-like [Oryza brachyantha]